MKITTLIISFIFLIGCSSNNQMKQPNNKWIILEENKWPQIVLTNSMQFKEREQAFGASAFLVCGSKDTFACTAKHLLGDAMGIVPEVSVDSFDLLLNDWKMYPRNNSKIKDTVEVSKLITLDKSKKDMILLKVNNLDKEIEILKPYLESAALGELVKIIGCEYKDIDCNQKIFNAEVVGHEGSQIILLAKNKFEISGFSGAPAVNSNGNVIGLISGAAEEDGKLYIYVESISEISQYLK